MCALKHNTLEELMQQDLQLSYQRAVCGRCGEERQAHIKMASDHWSGEEGYVLLCPVHTFEEREG